MRATGTDGETLFIPSIPDTKLLALESEAVYFNKNTYPRANMDNFPDTGAPRHRYADWVRDEDLFTVTFIPSREEQP